MIEKPTKAKPIFYSYCFLSLKEIAKEKGYNLVLHGSLNRDMDLIAIPWIDNPSTELQLIQSFDEYFTGTCWENECYFYTKLPGNRSSYIINLNRGGEWNSHVDEQWYLDISITPQ
jgi:hypothetical protein